MCRHVCWLGEPRSVSSLLLDPPHGLLRQSYAPRRQVTGRINADGWGVGLVGAGDAARGAGPARWRSTRPIWQDANLASLAPVLRAPAVLAAVRNASPGMPIEESATAPFTDGRWLLSLNGFVRSEVVPASPAAESRCDGALLAAHLFDRGPDAVGDIVVALAREDPSARLNVLATDGEQILATTWGNSLSYLPADEGTVVASEPYDDDPRWVDVPDRHLVRVASGEVTLTPLDQP